MGATGRVRLGRGEKEKERSRAAAAGRGFLFSARASLDDYGPEESAGSTKEMFGDDDELGELYDRQATRMTVTRFAFVLGLLMVGISSVVGFTAYEGGSAYNKAEMEFRAEARLVARTVELSLRDFAVATEVVKTFMDTGKASGADQPALREGFRAFADKMSDAVEVQSFQFIPVVRDEGRRQELEAEATAYWPTRLGGDNASKTFPFQDRAEDGSLSTSPRGEEYMPVTFVEPAKGNEAIINLNVLSLGEAWRTHVQGALKAKDTLGFGPLDADKQEDNTLSASIGAAAALENEDAVVAAVVRVSDMLARAVKDLPDGLEVHLFGGAEQPTEFGGFAGSPLRPLAAQSLDALKARAFFRATSFKELSASWTVVVCSTTSFRAVDKSVVVVPAIILSILFLALVVLTVLMMRREKKHSHKSALMVAEHAHKEAKAVTRAERNLNDFLAHEVRNPLTVAISAHRFLQTSLRSASWPDQDVEAACIHDVELVGSSLSFILELVSNMLDLNKFLEHQQVSLKPATVALGKDVLEPVAAILGRLNSSVTVQIELDEADVWVKVDALRLKQVIMNLAKNAIKFMPSGFLKLVAHRVSVRRVVLAVEDSGPGIPADKHENLFAKYQESLNKMHQGTGIGLCLSKLIVESMGGDIYLDTGYHSGVDSCPGARFVVDLPLPCVASPVATPKPAVGPDVANGHDDLLGGKGFLVVDDDAIVRAILVRRLNHLFKGVPVEVASSAEAAFEKLEAADKNAGFAAIFMDHYMPGPGSPMMGVEAIRHLREMGFEGLIFGCSANDVRGIHLGAGADEFFQKPLPSDKIVLRTVQNASTLRKIRSVLIVDDQEVNIAVMERGFRNAMASSCRVETALSGEACLDMVEASPFDIIVLDEHMGRGIRGSEAARRLRDKGCKSVLISLSGGFSEVVKNSNVFDAMWIKPLPPPDVLRSKLVEVVMRKRSGNLDDIGGSCTGSTASTCSTATSSKVSSATASAASAVSTAGNAGEAVVDLEQGNHA